MTSLRARFAGALVGAAAGDALGWPSSIVTDRAGLRSLGLERPLRTLAPWQHPSLGAQPAGSSSPESDARLALADAVGPNGRVDAEVAAKALLRGARPRRRVVVDASFDPSQTERRRFGDRVRGSALPARVLPVALANIHHPDALRREVVRTALLSHGHPSAVVTALAYAETLRAVVIGTAGPGRGILVRCYLAAREARPPLDDPDVATWVTRFDADSRDPFARTWAAATREVMGMVEIVGATAGRPLAQAYEDIGAGDPALRGSAPAALAAALAVAIRHPRSFRAALLAITPRLGTDASDIGALVGSLVGAALGIDAIPLDWRALTRGSSALLETAPVLVETARRPGRTR